MLHAKKADFKGLGNALKVDQVLARIMVNRGLSTVEEMQAYLNPSLDNIASPHLLKDMDRACDLLIEAINQNKKIRVIGDYDVDGIMSTYILTNAIKKAGGDVDYTVPHRIIDGYGVNEDIVKTAHEDKVEFIITCDNGIAAKNAVKTAKDFGMTFVITDHHEVPYEEIDGTKKFILPEADAIVDPKQENCEYPFSGICGAQVAWKLSYVLFEKLGIDKKNADEYLEFAAIATVCDVMELRGENRATVFYGLKALEKTENPGLHALLARNDLEDKKLSCYHLGFVIGPCLNATGRLDTAKKAIELLNEEEPAKALAVADELVELNIQRKSMTLEGLEAAKSCVEDMGLTNDRVLVIYLPSLHESLAGIVAGRIKETYYKPTLVITDCEDGAKGSGRSIEAYNMYEELNKVKDVFTKFGGHPMAAGISLPVEKIDELRRRLNENCTLKPEDLEEIVRIDVPLPLSYISEELIEQISTLEPFGNGNTKPLFGLTKVPFVRAAYMGRENQFLRLTVKTENGLYLQALLFRDVEEFLLLVEEKYGKQKVDELFSGKGQGIEMDIIYEPQINEYRDTKSIQIVINNFK